MDKMNRRHFFTKIAQITGVALVAPTVINSVFSSSANAQEKRRGGGAAVAGGCSLPLVEPGKGTAAAVKYVHKTADAAKKCSNCSFYAKKETCKGEEVGTCTIFAGQLVKSEGFCSSWNKKA